MYRTFRILLVDSCADTATSTAWLLSWWGHDVQVARDGRTALDLARTYRPEVVLTEIALPGLDGLTLAQRLRCPEVVPNAFLVAITGYGTAQYRHRCLAAGFDHYLTKPAATAVLQTLLERRAALLSRAGLREPSGGSRLSKPLGRAFLWARVLPMT